MLAECKENENAVKINIEEKLNVFDETLKKHKFLSIDTYLKDSEAFKIVDHCKQIALEVKLDTVIKTPIDVLIQALETEELVTCLGVTRIVGYYSRVKNWNKSKIGELRDRHNGNYGTH